MKKIAWVIVVGGLFVVSGLAQAQVDKMIDRFLQKGDQREDQRGEGRVRPADLRIVQLEFSPDPIREGQTVSFRVTVVNASRRSGRISLVLKDRDEVIGQVRDIDIHPGENQIDFPGSYYRFSGSDTCFTVEADTVQGRRPIDMAKEFCARRAYRGWTMSDRGMGYLYVEDLDMYPDPAAPGQDVRFSVRVRNDGRPIRGAIRIQDKDQVVSQVENVSIPRGSSEFQFPPTRYTFQRFDHCFTVVVDFERSPYPVDAGREFCAKPRGWSLRP